MLGDQDLRGPGPGHLLRRRGGLRVSRARCRGTIKIIIGVISTTSIKLLQCTNIMWILVIVIVIVIVTVQGRAAMRQTHGRAGKELARRCTRSSQRARDRFFRDSQDPFGIPDCRKQPSLTSLRKHMTPNVTPCHTSPPMPFCSYKSRAKHPMEHHVTPHRRRV